MSLRPTLTRTAAILAVVLLLPATPSNSATVASDFVLPRWQGTTTSPPAVGHQVDCSSTNPGWPSRCTITIHTVTSGSNCYVEAIANPASGVGGANQFSNTACQLQLEGDLSFRTTNAGCVYTPDRMFVKVWQSGINSSLFSVSNFPLAAAMLPVTSAGGSAAPNIYKLTVTSSAAVLYGHVIEMKELFYVNFVRRTLDCPNPDSLRTQKGNVYDKAVDVDVTGTNGFFKDTIAVL